MLPSRSVTVPVLFGSVFESVVFSVGSQLVRKEVPISANKKIIQKHFFHFIAIKFKFIILEA